MTSIKKDSQKIVEISDEEMIDLHKLTKKPKKSKYISSPSFAVDFIDNIKNNNVTIKFSLLFIICIVVLIIFNKYTIIKTPYLNIAIKATIITFLYMLISSNYL